ncbi:MAG: hypothetical protein GY878_01490 [Fuerstiella sp.]|nr:hypothetical protein [Fuerstiella sp.]
MAKCDIRITFDNPDRVYRGGDTVVGAVHIQVNEDIRCNGILLTHYWRTHGRGNTARGEKHEVRLSEIVPLQAGEELHFPFEFASEIWPLTYHGHHINLDHFVHVGVDVPWAIDPQHEEEYILLPGERPPEFTGGRGEVIEFTKKATEVKGLVKVLLFVIVAVLLAVLAAFAVVLIPVFLVGGGIYWIWKSMIASRVGEVELKVPHLVVGPGEQWPLELGFTPKKTFPVNGITLKIFAQEAATSGSGTNSTTHRHTLYEEMHTLHPAGALLAGERFSEQFMIDFPETDAWSIAESDNKIAWSAEIRIDIPRFPDWSKKEELQVIPLEFLDAAEPSLMKQFSSAVDDQYAAPAVTEDTAELEEQSSDSADSSDTWDTPDSSDRVAADAGKDPASLLAIISEIGQAGRFGNERSEIVAATEGRAYDLVVLIDRVSTTFGFPGDDARFENGRTITGTIEGTDQKVQLFAADTSNDSLDYLSRGGSWQTLATVKSWDSLYDRLVMHEVPFD